jgi:integrase
LVGGVLSGGVRPVSGHVFRVDGKRGARWYAKYRLPDGRQVQKVLGPAWEQRGQPPEGWFTKGTAEAWLREVLDHAWRGTLPGMVRTGATFADAAAEWLRYVERERGCRASTLADYRSVVRVHLLPAFGELPLERIGPETIERWLAGQLREGELSRRSLQKFVVLLSGIFKRAQAVWKLPQNPVASIERRSVPQRAEIEFYEPEEVYSLLRAAHDEQDGALYLTAAMTGLHMGELLALRWRDVDLPARTVRVTASYIAGRLGTPKSGFGRAVPLVDEVAETLARLGSRECWTGPDDLVFVGTAGEYLDGSALRRRFKRARDTAGLRPLRFQDLRHTFGSVAIRTVDPRDLQEWMGHSNISTTQIYMRHTPQADAAKRLSAAFEAVDGGEGDN